MRDSADIVVSPPPWDFVCQKPAAKKGGSCLSGIVPFYPTKKKKASTKLIKKDTTHNNNNNNSKRDVERMFFCWCGPLINLNHFWAIIGTSKTAKRATPSVHSSCHFTQTKTEFFFITFFKRENCF